jgi:Domain of unknown function (DUF4438), C-terminal/Domain of unknown function (DUF4438), N-terminal
MADGMSAQRPADNRTTLVATAIAGRIAPPRLHGETLAHDREGRAFFLPGAGGVNLGVHAGDPIDRWEADHLMVGAAIEDAEAAPAAPGALHLLGCIGNRVRDAQGSLLGVVAGKRGGLAPGHFAPNLLSVEIDDLPLASLSPGERVVVEAIGCGLALTDWPDIALFNTSPRLLDALPIKQATRLEVDVCAIVPARVAGAGLGTDAWIGDLEITEPEPLEGNVSDLCFGDLVAFADIDTRAGRYYRPGHVAIGLVAHGPSPAPGHGPGITVLITGPATSLAARVAEDATVGSNLRHWSRG